jgi:hypothetical protein
MYLVAMQTTSVLRKFWTHGTTGYRFVDGMTLLDLAQWA